MSDAPLPEAGILSDAEWERISRPANRYLSRFVDAIVADDEALRAALVAFRGESDRQELWSAEEVEPLIDALSDLVESIRDDTDTRHPLKRARAALAGVRSPEPAGCPKCGGQRYNGHLLTNRCEHPFHGRSPEPAAAPQRNYDEHGMDVGRRFGLDPRRNQW